MFKKKTTIHFELSSNMPLILQSVLKKNKLYLNKKDDLIRSIKSIN